MNTQAATFDGQSGRPVPAPAVSQPSSASMAADAAPPADGGDAEPTMFVTVDNPLLPIVIGMAVVFGAAAALIAFGL